MRVREDLVPHLSHMRTQQLQPYTLKPNFFMPAPFDSHVDPLLLKRNMTFAAFKRVHGSFPVFKYLSRPPSPPPGQKIVNASYGTNQKSGLLHPLRI